MWGVWRDSEARSVVIVALSCTRANLKTTDHATHAVLIVSCACRVHVEYVVQILYLLYSCCVSCTCQVYVVWLLLSLYVCANRHSVLRRKSSRTVLQTSNEGGCLVVTIPHIHIPYYKPSCSCNDLLDCTPCHVWVSCYTPSLSCSSTSCFSEPLPWNWS